MSKMNRLANISNRYQGGFKKVLCVCSAGLLRSPTAAFVLSQDPYNYNTRAVGTETEFALVGIDGVMLAWADEIVCMEPHHAEDVRSLLRLNRIADKKIVVLDIPDEYSYRDQALIDQIRINYDHAMQMEKLLTDKMPSNRQEAVVWAKERGFPEPKWSDEQKTT